MIELVKKTYKYYLSEDDVGNKKKEYRRIGNHHSKMLRSGWEEYFTFENKEEKCLEVEYVKRLDKNKD